MKNRIDWIDWGKAIGIMIVVYCHIPQEDSFFKSFLCSFQMPLFFMISGYLHNVPQSTFMDSLRKYWRTLIIPYILFQIIFYPYWLILQYVENESVLRSLQTSVIMPFIKCLLGIPINHVTWFLYALLLIKLITDYVSQKMRYPVLMILVICLCSMACAWFVWEEDKLSVNHTIARMLNDIPFFYVGYFLKQRGYMKERCGAGCLFWMILCFIVSWIVINYFPKNYPSQRLAFYISGLSGSFFIINACKLMKTIPAVIQTISIGTIFILGMHWMFIGTINFSLEKLLLIEGGIRYTICQSILLTMSITIVCICGIVFCKKYFKTLLGYR